MSGAAPFTRLPKPVLFALFGAVGGLLGALAVGEPLWHLLKPPAPAPVAPGPPPPPQFAVSAAAQVAVYPGGRSTFGVQIVRDRFSGPVSVTFEPVGSRLSVNPILIPDGANDGTAEVVADEAASPGPATLAVAARATADGKPLDARAPKPTVVQVLPLPPVPPRLAVSVAPKIQVYPRGKNTLAVQVARGGFAGPVEVEFENLPKGTAAPRVVFPAERSEVAVELTADATAAPGAHQVTATARAQTNGRPLAATAAATVEVLPPPRAPVDIVFALDISGSMQWAIDGTGRGIRDFVGELAKNQFDVRVGLVGFQDTTLAQPLKILKVNRERMTTDFAKFGTEVGKLRAGGGGAEGESSLDGVAEAARSPFRDQVTRVVVLITDEGPKRPDGEQESIEATAKFLREKRIDQIHVVTLPELRKEFEPLWEGAKGNYFDLKALNEGAESFEKLLPDVSKAIADLVADRPAGKPELPPLPPPPKLPGALAAAPALAPAPPPEPPAVKPEVRSLQGSERSAAGTEWRQVTRSGLWTGAVAGLVGVGLLVGQSRYLQGSWPPLRRCAVGFGGGLLVGLVGGAAGQGLFLLAKSDSAVVGALFRVVGWALLGTLAGAGLSLFIPNLGVVPGLLGGLAGGAAGAVGYLLASAVVGDSLGRLAGGAALGAALGLAVAAAERAFRRSWLEVRFGPREAITVNLGPEAVAVGGDARQCAVWARGAAPVALRFLVRDGRVWCADVPNQTATAAGDGFSRAVGAVTVTVRTGGDAIPAPPPAKPQPAKTEAPPTDDWDLLPMPAAPSPTKPQPERAVTRAAKSAPPAPVRPNISAAPKAGDRCPGCGRAIPGAPGTRYCMVCDTTF